jgi:hypothetical protein
MTDGTAEDVFPRRGAAGCSEKTAGRLAATSKSEEAASTPSGDDEKTGSETRRLECDNLSLAVLPPAR